MATLLTKPYRRGMIHYANVHELAIEKGFVVNTNLPLGKVARRFLTRLQRHMHAQHPRAFPVKYIDGTLNSRTKAILVPPVPDSMGSKALIRALKEVGVHEYPWGSNRGRRVGYYQSSTGEYGAAWCASFCCKMWQLAGYKGPTSAGAWNLTDNYGTRVSLENAKPGDCVSLDTTQGHVGILERVNHTLGTVTLVAGNTSDSVKIKDYPMSMIHSICRLG